MRRWLSSFDPAVRHTLERADRILSLSSTFSAGIAERLRPKVVPILAAGIEPRPLSPQRFERGEVMRVLYAGRLVELKGVRLALEAFSLLAGRSRAATFELCGDGPLAAPLAARVRALGLEERVRFHGRLSHDATLARMQAADVFLFPSFEGAGMVVPEAMAAGCPVVCLDFGGPGEMTGTDRGLRVPLGNTPEATAAELGAALVRLYVDEDRRRALARGARSWAVEVAAWDAKGERLAEIYGAAIAHRHGAAPQQSQEAA
jgi:glycosyltransferase involved in cell wall biosynthesis